MLENVDMSFAIESNEYKNIVKMLEVKLSELQRRAWELKIPIIFVFEGWHASGMGEEINRFILALDPRGYDFHTVDKEYHEDVLRSSLIHFWTLIPVRGRIAIFDRSWYSRTIIKYLSKEKSEEKLNKCLEEINWFERQLSDDGYFILKFFLHINEKKQENRLKDIRKKGIPLLLSEYKKKNKIENEKEIDFLIDYKEYLPIVETVLEKTDTSYAPWNIVEANNKNFTIIKIMTVATQAIENCIEQVTSTLKMPTIKHPAMEISKLSELNGSILGKVDLSRSISYEEYIEYKSFYQQKLKTLQYELFKRNRSMIIVFEGWDAAGKGGNIRRLIEELNPRLYRVVPVGPPNEIEKLIITYGVFVKKLLKLGILLFLTEAGMAGSL